MDFVNQLLVRDNGWQVIPIAKVEQNFNYPQEYYRLTKFNCRLQDSVCSELLVGLLVVI